MLLRHIDQIKRSCSVARAFGDNDLWDTVKTSVGERIIKLNGNEIKMINRYPQQNRRPPMLSVKTKGFRMKKGEILY